MSPENFQQIRAIVREEVREEVAAAEQRMTTRQDGAVEAQAANLTNLRSELMSSVTGIRAEIVGRLDVIDRRLERAETGINAVLMQVNVLNKSLNEVDQKQIDLAATRLAQQRAIDDLYRQIAELKRQQRQQ